MSLGSYVASCFLLSMFVLFPLMVNVAATTEFPFFTLADGYVSIRHIKFYFFAAAVVIAVVAEVLLLVTHSFNYGAAQPKVKQKFPDTVSVTDILALVFLFLCAVSTALSPYFELALLGEAEIGGAAVGRNNGMLIILLYFAVYVLITRCYVYREILFTALSVTSALVYLLTVLNGFYLDPLGMLEPFRNSGQTVFMEFFSTIGNKNMLSSFICVTLPVSICMAVHTEKLVNRIIYLVSVSLGTMAIIIGDSDSCILGIGVFAVVFLALYIRRQKMLRRYLLSLSIMAGSLLVLRAVSSLTGNNYKTLGVIPEKILFSNSVYFIFAALAIITAALYLLQKRLDNFTLPKAVPSAILGLLAAAALALLGTIIYFTAVNTTADLGSFEKLLRFNDAWGTHRGIMWIRSFRIFGGAPWYQKLFGLGPDTFYFAFQPYFSELENYGNSSTDAAHNEYINYLITIGTAGLSSYLAFTGCALLRALKIRRENPVVLAFAGAVIAYAVQAFVNISVPISAPLFFIFIALCEAEAKKTEHRN